MGLSRESDTIYRDNIYIGEGEQLSSYFLMQTYMKQATIPYLPQSELNWEALSTLLETRGTRLHISTLNWPEAFPYHPIAIVDVAYTEEGMALSYFVRGLSLRALSAGDGHYVHEDSCVEFFMQRERGDAYINFEFNVAGVCYASHHASTSVGSPLSESEYASIRREGSMQGQTFEEQEGLYIWTLKAFIPWTTMGYQSGEVPERLWANFYKCADGTQHPHYLSWAAIDEPSPAFHRPQFFGELVLAPKA